MFSGSSACTSRQVGYGNSPAPPQARSTDVGRRGLWMAVLDSEITQVRPVSVQQKIDHQPAFVEPQIFGLVRDLRPDQRPRAIAADNVSGRQRVLPVTLAVGDRYEFRILRDRCHIGVQQDVDVRHIAQMIAQDRLQIRLVEAVARVPALGTDLLWPWPVEQELSVRDRRTACPH